MLKSYDRLNWLLATLLIYYFYRQHGDRSKGTSAFMEAGVNATHMSVPIEDRFPKTILLDYDGDWTSIKRVNELIVIVSYLLENL